MNILSLIRFPGGSARSGGSDRSCAPALRAPRSVLRVSRFTLVELLVAMAILGILMMLLFRFFGAASDSWTKSASNMRIYQNARAAMELIEQDLKSMVLSKEPGAEVNIHQYGPGAMQFTFVSAVGEDQDYASELIEVTYQLNGTILERREVGDDATGNSWDFLGAPAGWQASMGGDVFQEVVGGVQEFSMVPYDSSGIALSATGNYSDVAFVTVMLKLQDEKIQVANLAEQTERTFTKTVFLNQ